ncbi:hypothetical protein ACFWYW_59355 [Nonomuraea sp. NPDC059023]|uniref:hypothetical protein n=1 Tax=unclassified Nonomuraea TaxID=2593643 RepID=UPI003673816F
MNWLDIVAALMSAVALAVAIRACWKIRRDSQAAVSHWRRAAASWKEAEASWKEAEANYASAAASYQDALEITRNRR